jgi:hypothetical protein
MPSFSTEAERGRPEPSRFSRLGGERGGWMSIHLPLSSRRA